MTAAHGYAIALHIVIALKLLPFSAGALGSLRSLLLFRWFQRRELDLQRALLLHQVRPGRGDVLGVQIIGVAVAGEYFMLEGQVDLYGTEFVVLRPDVANAMRG